ncbi:hypothetical protein ZWY2020_040896 [Hordeum vulgare]|nr:hypothetical protein ZWY2020_040896 [Hordeum vulgare]
MKETGITQEAEQSLEYRAAQSERDNLTMMGFGMVSLLNAVFRRAFTSVGLRPIFVAVDANTTLHFWAHPSLLSSSNDD